MFFHLLFIIHSFFNKFEYSDYLAVKNPIFVVPETIK